MRNFSISVLIPHVMSVTWLWRHGRCDHCPHHHHRHDGHVHVHGYGHGRSNTKKTTQTLKKIPGSVDENQGRTGKNREQGTGKQSWKKQINR